MNHCIPAVGLFIHKRQAQLRRVFERIRAAQPGRLYVIADGPRDASEAPDVGRARAITEAIDWPCNVERLYSDENLGLRKRIASGIEFILEQEPEAIFLEDDCLPDPTFFRYCAELLARYRDDSSVMMISGYNPLAPLAVESSSYCFTRYGGSYGWATWARAFDGYDSDLKRWAEPERLASLKAAVDDERLFAYYEKVISLACAGKLDTWDYSWTFQRLTRGGLTTLPASNLVEYIGWGEDAAHTSATNLTHLALPSHSMSFPLIHPGNVEPQQALDHRLSSFRLGFPEPDDLHAAALRLDTSGRSVQAMALAMVGRKRFPEEPRFTNLQQRLRNSLARR